MSESLVIFTAISNQADKQRLLQRFLAEGGSINVKNKDDETLTMKVLSTSQQMQIKCHVPTASFMTFNPNERLSVTFTVGYDKYLFDARPVVNDRTVTFTVTDLFHLQRRKNFRYTLPADYRAEIIVKTLNKVVCNYHFRMLDISTQGCAVVSPSDIQPKMNDIILGEISLHDREAISIEGKIKHIRSDSDNQMVLGIEFDHMAAVSESKIITAITDLQRDIFLRNKVA